MNFRFVADHHFVIGHDHLYSGKPCQDHALSFMGEDHAIAVIADGCGSGGATDMGARLMTFTTSAALRTLMDIPERVTNEAGAVMVSHERMTHVGQAKSLLQLEHNDLLATCGYVLVTPAGVSVELVGDGVIAVQYRRGAIQVTRIDWARNMPCYPIYEEDNFTSFRCAHASSGEPLPFTQEGWCFSPDEGWVLLGRSAYVIDEGIFGTRLFFHSDMLDQIAAIAVFTDGVMRIDNVDWKDALLTLLAFKNRTGEFVKRRMNRALTEFRSVGKGPLDDLAYAVVSIQQLEGVDHETSRENHS